MEYGLIGEKLPHSFSAAIHSMLADYNYELKELDKSEFDLFFKNRDFKAINVTIPYKQAVIPYLYEIDPLAKKIGAVNTIINNEGKLYGYNTDFYGMKALIVRNGISLKNKTVAILGSGGTSKTAYAVSLDLGAKKIFKVSRNKSDGFITYTELCDIADSIDIIINTTPVGMFPNTDGCVINISDFKNLSGVIDAIYNPLNTNLILSALNAGIKAAGGLYMLVAQAAFASRLFTGDENVISKTDTVYKEILTGKQNIVLTGMPGSGKTTLGKKIAEELNREFIDTDELFERTFKISIPDFFKKYGEEKFREKETEIIKSVCDRQSIVIATGGGAVTQSRNISLLKRNGKIFFIDKELKFLQTGNGRPLTPDFEALQKKYNERLPLYIKSADKHLKLSDDLNSNLKILLNSVKE